MPEETTEAAEATETAPAATAPSTDVEKQAFLDRLNGESRKRKEAETRAKAIEKQLADLQSQMEEREQAGLPELERERKRAELLEKRIVEAEARAEQSEQRVLRTQREQWVSAAAAQLNFANPARAARLIDDLDSIEDPDQAERAVKRLAKSDPYLVKADESSQPQIGRVLENGQVATGNQQPAGAIDPNAEAEMLARELKKLTNSWQSLG